MRSFLLIVCLVVLKVSAESQDDLGEAEASNVMLDASGLVVKMNSAIDMVLDGYRWWYSKNGNITVKLPKIDKFFGKGVYRGKFESEDGYFTNLATLHRTGDVDFFKIGSSVGINASMGLTVAEAGYKNYSLDILAIKQNGTIKAMIGQTSLSLSITLTYSPKCQFTLDYVHFDKLSGVKVDITGLGVFQLMFEQLSTWLISNFEPSLKTLVNKKLYHELYKVLKDKDICKYVPTF